jgi:hypothetical protein
MPRNYYLRIVIFAWIFYSFSISTVFQTFFTSFLVDPGLQKQITSLKELSNSHMEYGIPPGTKFMYGINDEVTNINEKWCLCLCGRTMIQIPCGTHISNELSFSTSPF